MDDVGRKRGDKLVLDLGAPLTTAVAFVRDRHSQPAGRTLHRHMGSFYAYCGTHYRALPREALRAELYRFLEPAMRRVRDPETDEPKLVPFNPTSTKVNQVEDALIEPTLLDDRLRTPCWLGEEAPLPAAELVPMANGLFHLPSGKMLNHRPDFFVSYSLPFAYDAAAPAPEQWLSFLASIWPDDEEARDTLQELIGLLLTSDTRHQKLFLVVGPKRSGKGTISHIIRALIGPENVAGPTLSSLAANFGLQPLIGKPVAIISDARLSGRADAHAIAERLLSISGEDAITVDRKHIEAWTGTLPTRFVIMTNELPRIADASGALASRFIVLTMTKSFYGQEDHGLTNRLIGELPGIFNWAVEGWRRLAERGYFLMPASSAEAMQDIEALSSPILAFLRACCVVAPAAQQPCKEMFQAWSDWCKAQGRDHPGTTQTFGRDLRSAVPGLSGRRPAGADRDRIYAGVRLRRDGDPDDADRSAGPQWSADSALHIARRWWEDREQEEVGCNGVDRGPSRTADHYLTAAERAALSPDALADEAELVVRGEALP